MAETEITYSGLNLFHKYIWNRMDYGLFREAIKAAVPHADEGYIRKKWDYSGSKLEFIATYDEKTFNFLYNKMIKENYKG